MISDSSEGVGGMMRRSEVRRGEASQSVSAGRLEGGRGSEGMEGCPGRILFVWSHVRRACMGAV